MPFILLNGNSPDFPTINLLMQAVKLRNTSSDGGRLPAAMYDTCVYWRREHLFNTFEQKRGTKGVFNLKTGYISFIYKNENISFYWIMLIQIYKVGKMTGIKTC